MSEGGREGGGGGADTELKTKNPHVNAGKHVLVDVGQICRFFPVCTAFLLTRLVGVVTSCHFMALRFGGRPISAQQDARKDDLTCGKLRGNNYDDMTTTI